MKAAINYRRQITQPKPISSSSNWTIMSSISPLAGLQPHVADAALMLCALGGCAILAPRHPKTTIIADFRSSVNAKAVILNSIPLTKTTSKRKYTKKPKDPSRDTSISFEEMTRMMNVYGPIKCLRNRFTKESGGAAKPESIRRKFYRWFPDFNQRYAKGPSGYFEPKAGHKEEMVYRETLRQMDKGRILLTRRSKASTVTLKTANWTVALRGSIEWYSNIIPL